MAADCHAKSHIDGGPPRAPRLPPRQAGHVEDDQVNINSRPMAPYTAVTVEPGTSDLGICDICGLESEEDPWKGGNDPWSSSAALLTVPPRSASEEEVAQPILVHHLFRRGLRHFQRSLLPLNVLFAAKMVCMIAMSKIFGVIISRVNLRYSLTWISAPYRSIKHLWVVDCQRTLRWTVVQENQL